MGDGDALIRGCSRRPWKGSRAVGPGRKGAREAASLTEGGLWATGVKQLEYLDIGHGWSQALWLFSVSGQRGPAARGQLRKTGLAIGRERLPSWLRETWTEP